MTLVEFVENCCNEISIWRYTRGDCEESLFEKGLRLHVVKMVDGKFECYNLQIPNLT